MSYKEYRQNRRYVGLVYDRMWLNRFNEKNRDQHLWRKNKIVSRKAYEYENDIR